ncbi:hypothetical protein [Streptomyces sp. NPDC001054]
MSDQPTVSVPKVEVVTYQAPRVVITPVTEVISPEPVQGRRAPGAYQHVLLDTGTGELSWHESTEHREPWNPAWKAINDVPRETWKRWHPGKVFSPGSVGPHMWFEPVPELINWTVDSGFGGRPYLNVEDANALLELVAPYAQEVLDGFYEAGGELDWSAAAAHAARNICRVISRSQQAAPREVDAHLVDFAEIVQRFPQVYRPEMLRLSLDNLAEECEYQTRFIGTNKQWHEEVKKVFGTPYHDGSGVSLDVLGVRSWYRTLLLDGDPRPTRDFRDWDAEHGRLAAATITSETTDAELERWIGAEEHRAAQQGVRILGAKDAAYELRAQLREQDWDRLAVVGAEVARLEKYREERTKLVGRVTQWGYGDSDVAGRARMSRQAVHKLRTGDKAEDTAERA